MPPKGEEEGEEGEEEGRERRKRERSERKRRIEGEGEEEWIYPGTHNAVLSYATHPS